VNVFPTVAYADFETAIQNAVTTVWPDLEIKACRFHLRQSSWRKIQSLGLSKQYGKKDSWFKSVLEENIRTVRFTTGGSLRLLSVGIFNQSIERRGSGTVLQLPARKLYWCRLLISSACLVRINACELFHANFNALFYSAHPNIFVLVSALQKIQNKTYIKMRSVTTRRFRKSASFKQENLISSKPGQYGVNLTSKIEFLSSVLYKFLTNIHL